MFKIKACGRNGIIETVDTADDRENAEFLRCEYIMAYGDGWTVWVE